MIPKRYTIVVENQATGVVRRFTMRPRPLVAALVVVMAMPALFGLAVRWSTRAELQVLRDTARTAQIENASYRAATAELAGQVTALQETITDLSKRATLDPQSTKALEKLMRNRAVGGLNDAAAVRSALSPAIVGPEDTFGILRELLGKLESRLHFFRSDIENRAALASAAPTIWPAHGWVASWFRHREDPFSGEDQLHTGLDISADKGSPVWATAPGVVESASWNGGYGNLIAINHGFGVTTRYAHLSAFAVKPGDRVRQNDVIGYVGSTGRATGPHLHYEVLVNGKLVDPMQFITGLPTAR
ncbi:MAG: M23 family metallopeptidase [Bacteroidales bacterium]